MEKRVRREQRVLRIFRNHGPAMRARNIGLSTDGDGTVTISCPTSAKANWAASALKLPPLCYFYVGSKSAKEARVEDGDLEFHFYANDVRQVRLSDCFVQRQRKRPGEIRRAWLYLDKMQLAETMYFQADTSPKELRTDLWEKAKKKMEGDLRYELVD